MNDQNETPPAYLPNGELNIHGPLASKFRVYVGQKTNGKPFVNVEHDMPTQAAIKKKADEELDRAFNGQ